MKSLSEYSKNVLTLLSGTVIAQALPILFAPVLTRIFSPEEFAVYGVYIAVVMFCTVLSSGRYELAIILPEDDENLKYENMIMEKGSDDDKARLKQRKEEEAKAKKDKEDADEKALLDEVSKLEPF